MIKRVRTCSFKLFKFLIISGFIYTLHGIGKTPSLSVLWVLAPVSKVKDVMNKLVVYDVS